MPAKAIAGFLDAHSLFSRNRNDEAVCELVGQDSAALADYAGAASVLAVRYSHSAVAQFLAGDASARLARWPEATGSFNRSLALDKSFAQALIARGVALVSSGKVQEGKQDLYSALMLDPKSAEAQAAMGWTLLKEGQSATSARRYFAAAVQLSPGYSVAAAGEGLAALASGEADKGAAEIAGGLRARNCTTALLISNSLLAADWIERAAGKERGAEVPGTEIVVRPEISKANKELALIFERVGKGDRDAFNKVVRINGANPGNKFLESKTEQMLVDLKRNAPREFDSRMRNAPSAYDFTRDGGAAHQILDARAMP